MLIASTLAIAFTWAAIALLLIGVGSISLKVLDDDFFLIDAFWMGLAVSVAFLEICNLLSPITSSVALVLSGIGVLGLITNRTTLFSRRTAGLEAPGRFVFLGILIVLFIAFRASGPSDYNDTGLYGAPSVRWIMTYPAVPGLANLHGRYGFNSSVFLCVAALNHGVWRDLAHHLFAGLLMVAMCITILPACLRVVRGRTASPIDWFYCILAIPVSFWATRSRIVGTLTDEPAAITCLVATGILFHGLLPIEGESHRHTGSSRMVVATALFALVVSFKVSTAVFALLAWCLAFSRLWLMDRSASEHRIYLVAAVTLSTAILLPWCVRGIILSGYPFFPSTLLGLPVGWKTPAGLANLYSAGIRSWGRDPDAFFLADTQGFAWIAHWLNRVIRDRVGFQVPLGISLSGLALGLAARIQGKALPVCRWLWLLLPSLAGMAFWFWASPDLRFAQFAIWTAAGTLGTWGIVAVVSEPRRARPGAILAMLAGLLLWCLLSFGWEDPYRALLAAKAFSTLPKVGLVVKHTQSGLAVYVPTHENTCWDSPLPCTASFDETLRLRDGHSMRWGFASEASKDYIHKLWAAPIR